MEELHLKEDDNFYVMPHAPYKLSNDERKSFYFQIKFVKFPKGYALNISWVVNVENHRIRDKQN